MRCQISRGDNRVWIANPTLRYFYLSLSLVMRLQQGQLGEKCCPGRIRRVAASWMEEGGAAVGRKIDEMTTRRLRAFTVGPVSKEPRAGPYLKGQRTKMWDRQPFSRNRSSGQSVLWPDSRARSIRMCSILSPPHGVTLSDSCSISAPKRCHQNPASCSKALLANEPQVQGSWPLRLHCPYEFLNIQKARCL